MPHVRLDQDLRSVTDFRANAAAVIDGVRDTRRPVVLTQHGRGVVVVMDVREYQRMIDALEEPARRTRTPPAHDPVEAYKDGVDRTLLRANLARPAAERIRCLEEMASFANRLRQAPRRPPE